MWYRTLHLGDCMPRADFYREQARRLISMARASPHPEFASQLEAQARLYLSLARLPESRASDLSSLLNEFNSQQMRHLRRNAPLVGNPYFA